MIACIITAMATGSSWSTAGTVGVALMGVGMGLGINPALTAGAVVSGAAFGDKDVSAVRYDQRCSRRCGSRPL